MKYIMAQPAINRFKWELDVQLTNLLSLGVDGTEIVLLFATGDTEIPKYFRKKYGVETYVYPDLRENKQYIPSIKPYLWYQFLKDQPWAEDETWFYMDADVIFREIPTIEGASPTTWLCSNTDSYLNPKYILSKDDTGTLFKGMQDTVGVNVEDWDGKSGGAQWVIVQPKADYWLKVYEDCDKLFDYMCSQEQILKKRHGRNYVPIQAWTAEMWSQLWNMQLWGIEPRIDEELDFAFATDDISRWNEVKILHNAGVASSGGGMFFKGQYVNTTPFEDDLSFVNPTKCSYVYVQAIKKAKENALPS